MCHLIIDSLLFDVEKFSKSRVHDQAGHNVKNKVCAFLHVVQYTSLHAVSHVTWLQVMMNIRSRKVPL